jgi:large subunit ribosomal protein L19
MERINRITKSSIKSDVPAFRPGDQVRVWCRIREKDRTRQVPFEGIVIRRRGSGIAQTCTVRRLTHGEGVERVFPLHAPVVERIEVLRVGKVRRARLYYLRSKVGKTRIASGEKTTGSSAPSAEASAAPEAPASPEPSRQPAS